MAFYRRVRIRTRKWKYKWEVSAKVYFFNFHNCQQHFNNEEENNKADDVWKSEDILMH